MKKSLLLTFAILLSMTMMAQNRAVFINETFDGTTLPIGWSIAGEGTGNWSIASSTKAGGSPNEIMLFYYPQFNGTSRLVTPSIDLTGVTELTIMFKHYIDNYSGSSTIGVATSSDNGQTWNSGWEQAYSTTEQFSVAESFTTPDMGQPDVKICIYFTGNSNNIDNWYFDDITIFSMQDLDLGITTMAMNEIVPAGDVPVSFNVTNYGATTITSIEANYQVEGFDMVTETFDVNIESLASETITFETTQALIPGSYNVTVNATLVNGQEDDDTNNNTLSRDLGVSLGTAQKIPMIEHFSSSTCQPCVAPNNMMNSLTNANPGKYSYVKYQMNWPGNGDPYYTNEGGTRRTYYGVNAVPDIKLDGTINSVPVTQALLDMQYNTPAFSEIRGAFNVDGNNITVTADIMAYVDMENIRAFVSVNEKVTTGNVGGNGESEFHHVMMKMLPNAQGSTISLVAGEPTRLEFTHDMSTTHVEEMEDLEVAVWLQNLNSKEIYNSHFIYEYTEHPYPVQNLQLTTNTDNTMTVSFEAPEAGNPTGYNIYINAELVAENTTDLEYTFPAESDMFYIAEVTAIYEDDKTSVKSVVGEFCVMGIEDNMVENHCSIYPNPANNYVTIVNNTEISSISIYNCIGALVDQIEVRGNSFELNTSKYDTGVYFMNIVNANGHSSSKKLVIAH